MRSEPEIAHYMEFPAQDEVELMVVGAGLFIGLAIISWTVVNWAARKIQQYRSKGGS